MRLSFDFRYTESDDDSLTAAKQVDDLNARHRVREVAGFNDSSCSDTAWEVLSACGPTQPKSRHLLTGLTGPIHFDWRVISPRADARLAETGR